MGWCGNTGRGNQRDQDTDAGRCCRSGRQRRDALGWPVIFYRGCKVNGGGGEVRSDNRCDEGAALLIVSDAHDCESPGALEESSMQLQRACCGDDETAQ